MMGSKRVRRLSRLRPRRVPEFLAMPRQLGIVSESKESGERQMTLMSSVLQREINPKGVIAYRVGFLSPSP